MWVSTAGDCCALCAEGTGRGASEGNSVAIQAKDRWKTPQLVVIPLVQSISADW